MLLLFCGFFLFTLPILKRIGSDFGSDGLNVIFNVVVVIGLMLTVGFLVMRIGTLEHVPKKRHSDKGRGLFPFRRRKYGFPTT